MKPISHPSLAWFLLLAPLCGGDAVSSGRWGIPVARAPESPAPPPPIPAVADDSPAAAAAVLRDYYAAIEARDWRRAYLCWGEEGASSRQTYEQFAAGFGNTARVEAHIGPPGPMGAAAGSRYVEVQVTVIARTREGATQRFAGTYVLRRAVVDGATLEQRRWHIDSAKLRAVTG